MIKINQLQKLTQYVLNGLDLYSKDAEYLLIGTAVHESTIGGDTCLEQVGGPALGIMQMEPTTERDIWDNYLHFRSALAGKLGVISGTVGPGPDLWYNLAYQIGMARIHYLRKPGRLPAYVDIVGMAQYWKEHYNTHKGKGTVEEFMHNFPDELRTPWISEAF